MFEKKTWVNRQSEHPARRRLTPTGNDNEYDVARAEGVIMEDGDAFDAETMNDLEKRVAEGFSTLDPADLGADVCVQVYACVKSGTVYELTGSGAVGRCKIPAAWNSGDTWSVNGKASPPTAARTPWTATASWQGAGCCLPLMGSAWILTAAVDYPPASWHRPPPRNPMCCPGRSSTPETKT